MAENNRVRFIGQPGEGEIEPAVGPRPRDDTPLPMFEDSQPNTAPAVDPKSIVITNAEEVRAAVGQQTEEPEVVLIIDAETLARRRAAQMRQRPGDYSVDDQRGSKLEGVLSGLRSFLNTGISDTMQTNKGAQEGTSMNEAILDDDINKAAGLSAKKDVSASTAVAAATTRNAVEPYVERYGNNISEWVPASKFHPFQRAHDTAFQRLALAWEGVVDHEADLEDAEVKQYDVDVMRRDVLARTSKAAESLLPEAILQSPAARFIVDETKILGTSAFVTETQSLVEGVDAEHLLPYTRAEKINSQLTTLADAVIDHAVGKVILNLHPQEVAERAAAALSMSNHESAESPLVVSVNGSDGRFYVPALQAASIVEHESLGGGIIPGRSDAVARVERPDGVCEETFLASVFMVQDLQDRDVTIIGALEPGTLPMPGRRLSTPEDVYGTLEINAVAVNGRNFERRLQDGLNTPLSTSTQEIGVGGLKMVTEIRRRTDLVGAVKWLSDTNFIGVVKPSMTMEMDNPTVLTAGMGDQAIVDAVLVQE